ncbi:MAG TPA: type II toxin-antitoxin system VapC family toxin [Casimicrobiaceae bacterium]
MKVLVPDASVLLKWVIPTVEKGHDSAIQVREAAIAGDVALVVPPLWLYEVGNTLARHFPDHAPRLLEALVAFGLVEKPATKAWREQALALTREYAVTFYDAAYHALALVEGGTFVTADGNYVARTQSAGAVMLLGASP